MAKKKKRPPGAINPRNIDRHKQPRLVFHLPQEMFDAFEAYVASLRPQPTEASVLRLALEDYLRKVGHWPPKADQQGEAEDG